MDYTNLEGRLREAADTLAADLTFGLPSDVRVMREAADAIAALSKRVVELEREVEAADGARWEAGY